MDEQGMEIDDKVLIDVMSVQIGDLSVRNSYLEAGIRMLQGQLEHDRDAWLACTQELNEAKTRIEELEHPLMEVES